MNTDIETLMKTVNSLNKQVEDLNHRLVMVEDLQWADTQRMLEEQGMSEGNEISAEIDWADISPEAVEALMSDILGEAEPYKAPLEYNKISEGVIEFPTQFTRQPQD